MIARDRDRPPRRCLGVVAGESVAERWLRPTLAGVNASWPDIAIDVETAGDHLGLTVGVCPCLALSAGSVRESRDRVSHCGAARTSVAAPATARKPALLRGWADLKEVQRILAEVHGVSERQRRWPRRVRIVSVEAVAEQWLVPRVATFTAAHPGVAIELETNHRGVDPDRRDVDAWLAYTGETAAPRPVTRREDTLLEDTLYEEPLRPVCSPALLAARGRPSGPADLGDWPLLYDLGWDADGAYWCARQGQATPDLSRASGFHLYSMLVQAAVTGLGAAIGTPDADRAGAGEPDAGPALRPPGRGARTVLPDHHGGRPAAARGGGRAGHGSWTRREPRPGPGPTPRAPSGAGCGRPARPRAGSRSPVSPRGSPAPPTRRRPRDGPWRRSAPRRRRARRAPGARRRTARRPRA